ncbi:MAG: bifunctional hydroxymethylpyrimidine kinase/phosphomethylpyrimidine kinase, partial [Syntrophobacterales bacterium]|nr:bifunctional hydroxymethylpyrimidine kinase/phosphomethylpyrimidine kinase [Syntrophobacterales bacterium]
MGLHEIKKRKLTAVVDPVMVSTTGSRLSKDGFSNALLEELIPVATIITPNYDEAEELLGKKIRKGDEEDFCKEMKKLGSKYVLLKGGHAKGDRVVDILYDGKEIRKYESVRLGDEKIKYHGTGCTLSALITGYLAKGLNVKNAIEHSKEHILKSIARSYAPGKGVYMIEQLAPLLDDMEKLHILEKMRILRYDIEKIMQGARICKENGVDLITIADSPMGRARVDSIIIASKIKRETGIETMPHICCRDRNLNALKSSLIGAQIEGIRNLLAVTGDPVFEADKSEIKSVFNLNSLKLIELISHMNEEMFAKDRFSIGGALNVNALNKDIEVKRMLKKAEK